MSIIQNIRSKYAKVAVVAIALALVGFILTDYFTQQSRNSMRGGGSSSVGSVNGKKISAEEFKRKVDQNIKQAENMYKQQGYPVPPASALTKDAVDQTWSQEVNRMLFRGEIERLGMQIGKKERGDLLYGNNAPEFIKKAGTDSNGVYNPMRAKQQVDQMMKDRRTPKSQKDEFNTYISELDEFRMSEKYNALFANSTNFPRWFVEKEIDDNSQIAKISMVRVLYTDSMFVDSTIKITDKEIQDYISKHKDNFKQEKSRSISFASISAAPSATDSAATKKSLLDLKPEFDTTKDAGEFTARNGTPLDDNYYTAAQLPPVGKDSITRLAKNAVYGPYLEGNSYLMLKMLDSKTLPDSVKARHILIQTFNPQTSQQMLDEPTAKKRIDSIEAAIKGGASFDMLAIQYSDDKGSGARGGVLSNPQNPATDYFTYGQMVKAFNEFCFQGKKGERKVVKTEFGYHFIEIMDQKNFQPAYKVAFLAKEITTSRETDDNAQRLANTFFSECKDPKTFDAAFEKWLKPAGGVKGTAINIGPMDAQVNGMGTSGGLVSRQFVKSIYKARLGEVLKPELVNNGSDYVVAMVTEINEEGTQPVAKARPLVEYELRKKKKAEIIKQKIGKVTTLEAAATALGKQIETIDSLRMSTKTPALKLGNEPKVIGAAFSAANKGKVVPEALEGASGIYVIRVENIAATPSAGGGVAEQRKARYETEKSQQSGPIESMKKAAKIKDKRSDTY